MITNPTNGDATLPEEYSNEGGVMVGVVVVVLRVVAGVVVVEEPPPPPPAAAAATVTANFMPPEQCPGTPQMK